MVSAFVAGRFRRPEGAALVKNVEIADVMDGSQNVQVKRGYLPKEAYLLLKDMQDECDKDVEAFTMRNHTEQFAQLRHDALWHQCHVFNWDMSGGELHIIADELDYWALLLRLPLQGQWCHCPTKGELEANHPELHGHLGGVQVLLELMLL